MLHVKDHKTGYIFDPWDYLGPKKRELLENSWAGVFRAYLFEQIPVERLIPYFSTDMGRPSKELYVMLGALILQQMFDLSDEEAQWHTCFDLGWQYALDITDHSDESGYVCLKTLWTYRQIVIKEGLYSVLFEELTDSLKRAFDVNTDIQRLDSTHVQSNMRKLGRIRIFAETIRKFLTNLKRQHKDLFDRHIEEQFKDRYLARKNSGCFSQVKPSETTKTLQQLSKDLFYLVEYFKDNDSICRMNSYQLMQRVLDEQCTVTRSDDDPEITIKAPKDVPSDSLQNPSDPDAGYNPHKGQGYSFQVMETSNRQKDISEKEKERQLDLITYVDATPAHVRDSGAVEQAIENTESRDCKPEELSADTSYGGDENVQKASEHDVELLAPAHHTDGQKGAYGLKDFECDTETGTITACPQGHTAVDSYRTKKDRMVSRFDHSTCHNCPHRGRCPVTIGKTSVSLYYTDKQFRLALRRQYEETEEFQERYRWRAGIEATNSRLKSQTGAGRLRYRGLEKVRYAINLKALGLNILRAARVYTARNHRKNREQSVSDLFYKLFLIFRPHFSVQVKNIFSKNIFGLFQPVLAC